MPDRDLIGRTLGPYILRELIAEGGYGVVYRGEEPVLEREVVVKVLHERRSDGESRERFLREARLASQLDHPYATHIYAYGAQDEGRLLWIAMERVRGVPLDVWLDKHGPMSPESFGRFFEGLCDVIHAAHKQGIIHRDLKPSNIMVIECEGRLLPKLLDFGIAKWRRHGELTPDSGSDEDRDPGHDDVKTVRMPVRPRRSWRTVTCHDSESRRQLTPPGGYVGSPPYMALELWVGADTAGPEADIYALAIIAHETLTGRRLFVANRTAEYFEQHKCAPAPPPLGEGFPPALDLVIRCALDKDPRARPATALELASHVRTALRKIKREQLRTSAQQWSDQARAPGLLWGADVLANTLRSVPQQTLSPLERAFVAASERRIRHIRWVRRALVAVAVVAAIGWFLYRASMQTELAQKQTELAQEQTRLAREVKEATVRQAELEQGRSALIHDEPEAQLHLSRAYQRGDRSPSTAFMLARSMQSRLAQQAQFSATYGRMWSATFSPDGKQIATTDDRAAQIWDARTYRLLFTLPHGREVYFAVYSADGMRLVTAAETMVRIWDTTKGTLLHDLKREPNDRTSSDYYLSAISSDGKFVAAIDAAGSVVHVWNASTGAVVAELPNSAGDFPALAFSSAGWLATTGGNDVRVFSVGTWKQVLTIPGPRVHSLAFDSHSRLVTGAATGEVALWAIPSGAPIRHLQQMGEPISAVAFSSDGRLIAAGSSDGTMQVWRAGSGELQSQLTRHHNKIFSIEFDAASKFVAGAGADGTVVVADSSQGLRIALLEGPQNSVRVAHFDPNSSRVVGASWDGTVRVWNSTSPYRRWSSDPISDDCGIVMESEPDQRFVAVGCRDRPTRVWDTAHDQLLAELPSVTPIDGGGFTSAFPAVSTAGDRAAIAHGNAVLLYELPTGRLLRTIAHGAQVSAVAFASTGRDLVSGAVDGSLLVTRDDGWQRAFQASGGIDTAKLLPGDRVMVSDAQRRLRVYKLDGAVLADLESPVRMMSLRLDGDRVLALPSYTSDAAPPLLLDIGRYRVIAQLEGHVGQVFSARWMAGDRIITTGADGMARLWDGATGRLLQVYQGGARFLADAALVSDRIVVAGGADGLLRFWDAASGAKLWMLQAHKSAVIGVHVEGGDLVTRGFSGEVSRWTLPEPHHVMEACLNHLPCAIVAR